MNHSEKLAIAAHLHVLLRRKTGRVTDTEWMASNGSYAREIARFARERAVLDQAPELIEWADRLDHCMQDTFGGRVAPQCPRGRGRPMQQGRLPHRRRTLRPRGIRRRGVMWVASADLARAEPPAVGRLPCHGALPIALCMRLD